MMTDEFLSESFVIFNTVAGISVMGVILDELGDSFIVGLPARLVREDGEFQCEPYVPAPMARFFKGTLLNYVPLEGNFELPYLLHIDKNRERIRLSPDQDDEVDGRITKLLADQSQNVLELPSRVNYIFPDVESIH